MATEAIVAAIGTPEVEGHFAAAILEERGVDWRAVAERAPEHLAAVANWLTTDSSDPLPAPIWSVLSDSRLKDALRVRALLATASNGLRDDGRRAAFSRLTYDQLREPFGIPASASPVDLESAIERAVVAAVDRDLLHARIDCQQGAVWIVDCSSPAAPLAPEGMAQTLARLETFTIQATKACESVQNHMALLDKQRKEGADHKKEADANALTIRKCLDEQSDRATSSTSQANGGGGGQHSKKVRARASLVALNE